VASGSNPDWPLMDNSEAYEKFLSERRARREAIRQGSELARKNTIPLSKELESLAELHADCEDPVGGLMFFRLALRAASIEEKKGE
jgi:hypothetical protein